MKENYKTGYIRFAIISMILLIWSLPNQTANSRQESSVPVISVAWSPNGLQIATGQNNGTIRIWDAATGQVLDTFYVAGEPDRSLIVYDVKWSPDGGKLAAAATSGRSYALVSVLDAVTGQVLASFSVYTESYAVDWSPDGTKLAGAAIIGHAGAWSSSGVIKIWDTVTWQELASLDEGSAITSVAWSPDGTQLASGDVDGMTIVRNVTDWQWLHDLWAQSTASAFDITWSPDGALLAVASGGGSIRVWSTSTQQVLQTFECSHTEWLIDMSWSPNGTQIAAACSDGIRIWDVTSGLLTDTLQTVGSPNAVDWSPDGTKVVYGGRNETIEILNVPPSDPRSAPES